MLHINGMLGTYHATAILQATYLGLLQTDRVIHEMSLEIVAALSRLGRVVIRCPQARFDAKITCRLSLSDPRCLCSPALNRCIQRQTNSMPVNHPVRRPGDQLPPTDKGAFEAGFRLYSLCDVSKTDPTRF